MTRSRRSTCFHLILSIAALGAMAGCSPDLEPEADTGSSLHEVQQAATAAAVWTPYISEEDGMGENGGTRCPDGMATIGVECNGSFCDNVRIRCDHFEGILGAGRWTNWVEYDAGQDVKCGTNEWMTGIKCWGDYCDNVSIRCTASSNAPVNCYWTPQLYSEEQGAYTTPSSQYIAGIHCEGTHCDNKRYWVCQTRPAPENSCSGRCGGVSTGGACYCDEACLTYGDCCSDYERLCQ